MPSVPRCEHPPGQAHTSASPLFALGNRRAGDLQFVPSAGSAREPPDLCAACGRAWALWATLLASRRIRVLLRTAGHGQWALAFSALSPLSALPGMGTVGARFQRAQSVERSAGHGHCGRTRPRSQGRFRCWGLRCCSRRLRSSARSRVHRTRRAGQGPARPRGAPPCDPQRGGGTSARRSTGGLGIYL